MRRKDHSNSEFEIIAHRIVAESLVDRTGTAADLGSMALQFVEVDLAVGVQGKFVENDDLIGNPKRRSQSKQVGLEPIPGNSDEMSSWTKEKI